MPDADALLAAVAEHRPDATVVDVRMPPAHTDDGLRAAVEIRRRWPGTAVLVHSQWVERRYADQLLDGRGGIGYLLKDRVVDVGQFLDALGRVAAGGAAFDPEVVRQLLARDSSAAALDRLTGRERDVLAAMAEG